MRGPALVSIGGIVLAACGSAPVPDPAVIGPAGGTLSEAGAVLRIPAGALRDDTRFTIHPSGEQGGNGFGSGIYEFRPWGLTFGVPVQVTLPRRGYDPASVYWSTRVQGFYVVPATIADDASSLTVEVTTLGDGFVGFHCVEGDACRGEGSACLPQVFNCTTGVPHCETVFLPDGTPCGAGLVCLRYQCVPGN